MDTRRNQRTLPAVTTIEGYTVEQALESEPNVLRYSAHNAAGDRVVLVELFPPEVVTREGVRVFVRTPDDQEGWQAWIRSFAERTRQLTQLNHPGLVRIRHSFVANGTAYCVIDPIGGETLASVLEREGTLPEPRLRQLLSSLIVSLQEAHNAGLLHGDIEPSRIRLQFDGKAILSGFATLVTPIRLKGHTVVNTGTPGYAPPEHLLVQAAEQPSSDIYSLAAIAYRAITGEAPPEARMRGAGVELKPSETLARGRYSAALMAAVDAALSMRAQQRPQTLSQWRQLLESEEAGTTSRSASAASKSTSVPMVWMVAPAVLVVAVAGYFLTRGGKSESPKPQASAVVSQAPEEAAPAVNASPAPASTALPVPTLDQLAIAMLKKGQKPLHTPAPPSPAAANPNLAKAPPGTLQSTGQPVRNPAVAPPATTAVKAVPGQAPVAAAPATAAPAQPPAAQTASTPAPTAAAAPPPAVATPSEADKAKEQQTLQKAASDEAARQSQKEAAAKDAAAKDAAAKQAAANDARDKFKRIVARAKAKCEIPAPELSESENLIYDNAMAVPGATRLRDGSIRLPEVTLGDGTTAQFAIDADSCAHRIQ